MDVRERIIQKAAELFFIMGVKKVKMDDIAQKLRISKRTIYEHFKNKDSLIRETIQLAQSQQNEVNDKILRESETTIAAVLTFLRNGSEILATVNPDYFADLQRLYPKIWKEQIEQSKIHSYNLILELIRKGKKEGIYREDINEKIIAIMLIEQLNMLSNQQIFPSGEFSIVEVYENIIINMTRGAATAMGLELLKQYRGS